MFVVFKQVLERLEFHALGVQEVNVVSLFIGNKLDISELLNVMELDDTTLERNNLIFDVIIVLVDGRMTHNFG